MEYEFLYVQKIHIPYFKNNYSKMITFLEHNQN
jgi:hypothetical protein